MTRVVEVRAITKRFGETVALDGVSAEFRPGEVHAVVGENGAGKSTLAEIVAGFVTPSEGQVLLDGTPLPVGKPFECKRLGIEMIHQHFALVPEFTVAENLALSNLKTLTSMLDVNALAKPALDAGKRLGWEFEPEAPVRTLSVGVQQRLEIVKALGSGGNVILFDEPTAVLTRAEAAELLRVLAGLREEGKSVVLIAHKLSEVMAIADRVTVLRRGKVVAQAARGEFDEAQLAYWMVGEMPPQPIREVPAASEPGLTVRKLIVRGDRGETRVNGISFEVGRHEILGIGGVDGNGQLELAEALAGVRPVEAGSIEWKGGGTGYIPQDRRKDGLALGMSISDNLLATGHRKAELSRGPFLFARKVLEWANRLIERFSIQATGPWAKAGGLSGGNQQKVVVARTLDMAPELLVVAGPSRGLDVSATRFVHDQLSDCRAAGAATVLFSSDIDELATVADRVVYMSSGRFSEGEGAVALVGGAGA